MRMPLNVTGIPLLLEPDSTWITILDNSDQPENTAEHVRFLTLFGLATRRSATQDGTGCDISLRVENMDTGAVVSLGVVTVGTVGGLALIGFLNQYPLRGNVRVQLQTDTAVSSQPVFVYGYYEVDSTDQRPERFVSDVSSLGFGEGLLNSRTQRSFQPDLGQVSIDSLPVYVSGVAQETVHQFSTDYTDMIDLHYQGTTVGGPDITTSLWFYDGGDRIAQIQYLVSLGSVLRLFQNIPMRAAAIPSILIPGLPAGIYAVGDSANDRISVWGRFFRA